MFRELLNKYLSFNIFNFVDSDSFDMEESIEKTNKTLEAYPQYNHTLTNYISFHSAVRAEQLSSYNVRV